MSTPQPLPGARCERCGQTPDKDCYMPARRCPRPGPQRHVRKRPAPEPAESDGDAE